MKITLALHILKSVSKVILKTNIRALFIIDSHIFLGVIIRKKAQFPVFYMLRKA